MPVMNVVSMWVSTLSASDPSYFVSSPDFVCWAAMMASTRVGSAWAWARADAAVNATMMALTPGMSDALAIVRNTPSPLAFRVLAADESSYRVDDEISRALRNTGGRAGRP